jgi:hypothetical protein
MASTITNTVGNISLLQTSYSTSIQKIGEVARAQDFLLTFPGDDTSVIQYLVQSATTPAIKREVVETVGPFGVRSIQQGRFINEIEMAITFKETVTGAGFVFLQTWARDKLYQIVTVSMISESTGDSATAPTSKAPSWTITECWIELDGADLSVEDAVPLKLSGTLHGSFFPDSAK